METELVKLIPSILWFLLVIFLNILFYRPIRDELLPKLGAFKAMGVELCFVKDSIEAALELAEKSPLWKVEVLSTDREQALKRARKHLHVLRDAQFLWEDDHPENNLNERRILRQLKADVDTAKSTKEPLGILKNGYYDLVISDMAREDEPTASRKFLEHLLKVDKTTSVILYVGIFHPAKGIPAKAFGIIN